MKWWMSEDLDGKERRKAAFNLVLYFVRFYYPQRIPVSASHTPEVRITNNKDNSLGPLRVAE